MLPHSLFNSVLFAFLLLLALEAVVLAGTSNEPVFTAMAIPAHIEVKAKDLVSMLMELKIENKGNSSLLIDKFETPKPIIKGPNGFIPGDSAVDTSRGRSPNDWFLLENRFTTYIPLECSFMLNRKGEIYMQADARNGERWGFGPMAKGKWEVWLLYEVKNAKPPLAQRADGSIVPPWEGSILSNPVEIEIR